MIDDLARVEAVRAAFPPEGLFAAKEWLLSPRGFALEPAFVDELEKLGYRLHLFQRACNRLYQLSVSGKQPAWVAHYLDLGKPPELVALSRERIFRDDIARVIRPDVILTDDGFTIAELDTVPGGIGLTAWLNETYANLGDDVIGGPAGMIDGFAGIFPGGDILVAEEAATYRPEMRWLADRLNGMRNAEFGMRNDQRGSDIPHSALRTPHSPWRVLDVDSPEALAAARNGHGETSAPHRFYRFFEHFDLANVPVAPALMEAARAGRAEVTPPFKPYLEEKMWFALFWMRPLRDFWRRELGDRHWRKLQQVIPYTWILDPAPLPHHAGIPRLEIHDWRELGDLSQKERDLILKISGYSELAWGSRGVDLASDLPAGEWKLAVARALERFEGNPMILQQFRKGRLVDHPYLNPQSGDIENLHGRVRLCPYYFLLEGKAKLSGVLATVVPADKKLIHGMRDAVIVPGREAAGD